jgi:ATP-dependent RNA helicase RhlE
MSFDTFSLNPALLKGVQDLGFSRATPIQSEAIPPGMEGRDVLACAMTGSGKTAAFLLPIVHKLMERPRGTTRALILTPTRELAAQIHQHLGELAVHTGVKGAAVFGGVGAKPQEQAFRQGVDIIIATPGRLLDHLQYSYASFDKLEYLVLDEADRMLDMGFLPDIRRILKHVPTKRQTFFFSATLPPPIVKLGQEMLDRPASINVERRSAPAKGITQAIYPVPQKLKARLVTELLRRDDLGNAIVFCRTKHRANRLAEVLDKEGFGVARIHGNRSQTARTEALAGFKSGKYRVLVATDIVARGIDVEALEHVVNFDVPNVPEDYIHRVGRTARAEATGEAYTLVSPEEEQNMKSIERAVGKSIPRVRVPDFDYGAQPAEALEIPLAQRIAEIRRRKKADRERAKEKADARAARAAQGGSGGGSGGSARGNGGGSSRGHGSSGSSRSRGRRGNRGGGGGSGGSGGGGRGGSGGRS